LGTFNVAKRACRHWAAEHDRCGASFSGLVLCEHVLPVLQQLALQLLQLSLLLLGGPLRSTAPPGGVQFDAVLRLAQRHAPFARPFSVLGESMTMVVVLVVPVTIR
jgi:hypothetical protein